MTRRTLDVIFATGGLVLAGLILVLGLVLQNQANFAKDYVHNQLAQQQIQFTPASGLKANENDPCLKTYAGQQLVTGKQAECYANHYIAVHLGEVNNGKTYAETSNDLKALPDQNSAQATALNAKVQPCSEARRSAVCCSPATASASSVTAPRPPPTSVTSSRSCCSWPRSPASSTPPPGPPNTKSSPLPPPTQHKHRRQT